MAGANRYRTMNVTVGVLSTTKHRVNSNPKRNFFLSSIRAIIFHIAKAD